MKCLAQNGVGFLVSECCMNSTKVLLVFLEFIDYTY